MSNLDIKKSIDILKQDNAGFIRMYCNRKKLLKYNISEIEKVLREFNLKDLLNVKYAIELPLANINLRSFWLILLTVMVTELVKDVMKNINSLSGFVASFVAYILIYFTVSSISKSIYGSNIGRFRAIRKKKVLIDIINIEIEKRKNINN